MYPLWVRCWDYPRRGRKLETTISMFTPPELFSEEYEVILTIEYYAELTCPMANLVDPLNLPLDAECECMSIELSILDQFEKLDII